MQHILVYQENFYNIVEPKPKIKKIFPKVAFDYNNKSVVVHSLFYPSGNKEKDFKKLYKNYKNVLNYRFDFN